MARSPNYPQLNLSDAIERVRAVWKEEQWNNVPALVVAEHLGYKSLSGTAQVVLSALRKYGLLEGSGDDLKVSKRGMTLVEFEPESAEYKDALRQAALEPALFAELAKEHKGKALPSESNLRTQLLTRDFSSAAAAKAARSYLETMTLVAEKANGYTESDDEEPSPEEGGGSEHDNGLRGTGRGGAGPPPPPPPAGRLRRERRPMNPTPQDVAIREDIFSMAEGDVVLQWPSRLTQESFNDFQDWLKLIERKAQRAVSNTPKRRVASLGPDDMEDPENEEDGAAEG